MKKIHTFESFTNSVSEGKLNMKKMIKAAGKALSKGADNDDLDMFIDDYLDSNGIPFDEFDYDEREELYQGLDIQYGIYIEEKSHVSENKPVKESIQFGSHYYNDRTWAGEFIDDLPEKGNTKYLVFAHNEVDFNGQRIRLENGGSKKQYIGIFDDEAYAMAAYNTASRKPEGTFVSFSMGTLFAKSKFSFQYEETQGKLAKIRVK